MHIPLTQAPHHSTSQKSPEIRRTHPEGYGEDVPGHGVKEGGASAMGVGEGADEGRGEGLEEGEEGAEEAAEEDDVIAGGDGAGEGGFVGVEVVEEGGEEVG